MPGNMRATTRSIRMQSSIFLSIYFVSVCLLSLSCVPSCCFVPRCRKRSFDRRQVSRTRRKDTGRPPSTSPATGCTKSSTSDTDRRTEETGGIIAAAAPADRTSGPSRRKGRLRDRVAGARSTTLAGGSCKFVVPTSAWRFSQVNLICVNANTIGLNQSLGGVRWTETREPRDAV